MSDKDRKMSPEEIRHIAEDMIEDLRDCEDGYITTTGRLASDYGYGEEELGFFGLFDLHEALFRAARANHITLDMSSHEGKVEGLPFNLDFVVHNKKAQIKCPRCGSKDTARYIYGYPAFSDKMQEMLDKGKWVLGGCCISTVEIDGVHMDTMPSRHCNHCKKDFASPPLLFTRKNDTVEDYRDIVTAIKFGVGGYFQGNVDITITKSDSGALVHVDMIPYGIEAPEDRQIRPDKWRKIIVTLYNHLYIHEWKKKYVDYGVLDGEQWELEVNLTGGRKRTIYGSNAYPPYWTELKRLFREFAKL